MPNNRNRNRNRNRNKRNKNQNANQTKQPEEQQEEEIEQPATTTSSSSSLAAADDHQHNDNNANSGSISNGSSTVSSNDVADGAPAGIASNHDSNHNNSSSNNNAQQVTRAAPVNQPEEDQPKDLAKETQQQQQPQQPVSQQLIDENAESKAEQEIVVAAVEQPKELNQQIENTSEEQLKELPREEVQKQPEKEAHEQLEQQLKEATQEQPERQSKEVSEEQPEQQSEEVAQGQPERHSKEVAQEQPEKQLKEATQEQPEQPLEEATQEQPIAVIIEKQAIAANQLKNQLNNQAEHQLQQQLNQQTIEQKESCQLNQLSNQQPVEQLPQQPVEHIVPVILEKESNPFELQSAAAEQQLQQPAVHIVPVFVEKTESCTSQSAEQAAKQSKEHPKEQPKEELKQQPVVHFIPVTIEQEVIETSSNMGAKHSKQQREQQQQQKQLPEQHQQQQQKELPQEQQQQQQQTPKAPGSPRQAKVIVHRIVREEVDEVDGTQQQQQQQQQQQPQLQQQQQQQQPLKFQHQHEQLPQQQPPLVASQQSPTRQQPAPATLPQQRSTKVIIHQIRVETDEEERARKGKPTIEEISSTTATSAAGTAATTMHSNSNGSIPSSGTLSPPPRYLVESPSPKTPSQMAQFGRFARDVQIQELELNSDCSSGEFNFSGMQSPVVCEVDSEVEAEPLTPQQPQAPTTAVATFSPDVPSNSRAEQQEQLRQRRVQKRVALESHFLPQLLSPRYLDSILEENSETTASGHELALSRSSSNDPSHTRAAAASVPAKANESFPRSQLDFSRRHRRREEPVALMLETKLLDQPSDLESCTRLQSTLSPQSEDAELVYLSSSASSSVSDLMELELEQAAALAERALIDLDTDASKLINRPNDSERYSPATTASTTEPISSANETETEGECEVETEVDTETETNVQSSRESTPVNAHRGNEEPTLSPSPGSSLSSLLSAATTPTPAEAPTATPTRERATAEAAATSTAAESNEFGLNKLANSSIAASSLSATREEFVRNMEKVRELIEMTRREEENVASNASAYLNGNGETEAERIKKLRLLCTETLASMPYGEQMLEELASVAQNITDQQQQQQQQKEQQQQQSSNNMPYPLPHLPHISELQLSLGAAKNDAWLGLPTQADPKLLVCLSPGQRALVEQQSSKQSAPDQLLDAHEKFVQRRGYHELSAEQVRAMDSEQLKLEQEQMLKTAAKMRELRKSLTPQPEEQPQQQPQQQLSPVPPPVPVKSAETAAKAKSNQGDDVSQQVRSSYQKVITSATSSFENKPTAADQQQQQPQLAGEKLPHSFDQRTSSSTEQQQQTRNSSYMSSNSSNNKFPASMESELARMFPSIAQQGDIFDEQRKRFSNIEQSVKPAQTKRYSNIETSSFESKKRVENGQVVYDYSNSSREHQEEGEKPQTTTTTTNGKFPLKVHQIPVRLIEDEVDKAPPVPPPPAPANIMSATKLNGKPNTFIDDAQQQPQQQQQQQQLSTESNISRSEQQLKVNSSSSNTYEEFRQRAKAAIEAIAQPNNSNNTQPSQPPLDNEKLFKDFDALSQQLNAELQTSRVQREQRDKSASLYDLSRLTQHSNNQSQQQLEQLQQRRHAHMQELEREIERSARSRQERLSSVPRSSEEQQPVEYRARRAESLCNLQQEPLQRPHSSAEHYRVQPQQQQQDDWSRYASDLGYSENIARPFAREVEICYQRQHQRQPLGIRAPRLSMSTNDLSSSSYDSYNAYGGARRHAPMLQQAPQQQRPHYASCYSMIERDPNPTYISTTSRRGVSPAPPAPVTPQPPAYDRQQRRASLPRELHEQQLKYILSKEEELKLEFERLQQERRRLMDEMQRAPTVLQAPPPRRDSYRPAPKLPTLSEDEVFRQQMAEEWMNKVAEREERRQHKIIKISKIEDEQQHATEEQANISDEFLNRVKERRHKLAMPADSDWESGAESQPNLSKSGQAAGSESSDVEAPPMRVLEGKAEANLRELPRHLREFAKFASSEQLEGGQGHVDRMEEQERSEMITDNSHSSASKKSSIVKTYKVSRLPPSVQDDNNENTNSNNHNNNNNIDNQSNSNIHNNNDNINSNNSNTTSTTTSSQSCRIEHETNSKSSHGSIPSPRRSTPATSPSSPFLGHLHSNFDELFAHSPFRSKIFEEFDKYWRNFEHTS